MISIETNVIIVPSVTAATLQAVREKSSVLLEIGLNEDCFLHNKTLVIPGQRIICVTSEHKTWL